MGKVYPIRKAGRRVPEITADDLRATAQGAFPKNIDFSNLIVALGFAAPEHVKAIILNGFESLLRIRDLALERGDTKTLAVLDEIGIYTEDDETIIL